MVSFAAKTRPVDDGMDDGKQSEYRWSSQGRQELGGFRLKGFRGTAHTIIYIERLNNVHKVELRRD